MGIGNSMTAFAVNYASLSGCAIGHPEQWTILRSHYSKGFSNVEGTLPQVRQIGLILELRVTELHGHTKRSANAAYN